MNLNAAIEFLNEFKIISTKNLEENKDPILKQTSYLNNNNKQKFKPILKHTRTYFLRIITRAIRSKLRKMMISCDT